MKLIEVKDRRSAKEFLDVARIIYKDDENWVCPLDKDIESVFNPDQNTYFKHGTAVRWVLKDDYGKLIGRISAFIDHKSIDDNGQPIGCCGFFECIDDQDTANTLFNTAKDWLEAQGIEVMEGPVNFGENDKYWGLLVDGFTQPAYNVAYNPPYYQNLFESYGFKTYYKQEGFHFDVGKPVSERFRKIAERLSSKPEYSFEHFRFEESEKYVADFTEVFNGAWKDYKKDFEPMSVDYVRNFVMGAKAIIEEKFIWFGYSEGRPVAIYLMIPDVNQIFRMFNGKLNLWNKLRLLYMVKTKKMTRAIGILMGVIPKFQRKGIESAFILHLEKVFKQMPHYTELEFSWVGDFNPPMRKLWLAVGAVPAKHYITYRYLFDPNAEFKRYPIPE
ncbi:GNAT family N-acetyltransferase [Bacteroidota bacterium]